MVFLNAEPSTILRYTYLKCMVSSFLLISPTRWKHWFWLPIWLGAKAMLIFFVVAYVSESVCTHFIFWSHLISLIIPVNIWLTFSTLALLKIEISNVFVHLNILQLTALKLGSGDLLQVKYWASQRVKTCLLPDSEGWNTVVSCCWCWCKWCCRRRRRRRRGREERGESSGQLTG